VELNAETQIKKQIIHVQRQPYVKVEFRLIRRAFKEYNLGRNERDLYRTMAYFVEEAHTDEISCSIPELCEETQMSDKPLKKALKALQEKQFITKLLKERNKGRYRLNIGIFNGLREKQRPVDNAGRLGVDIPLQLGVDIPLPHVRVLKSSPRYINKQQQQVVVDFKFSEESIFRELDPDCLYEKSKKHGAERTQKVITRLEEEYTRLDQIKKSIEILFNKSVENPKFDFESPKKKKIREERRDEALKRAEERRIRAKPIENRIRNFPKWGSIKKESL